MDFVAPKIAAFYEAIAMKGLSRSIRRDCKNDSTKKTKVKKLWYTQPQSYFIAYSRLQLETK
jgi:hypothetical protein